MSDLRLQCFDSIPQLLDAREPWNDLLQRCDVVAPTLRVECIALWCETFAAGEPVRVIAVEQDGRLVAALPLVQQRLRHVVRVGSLPQNHWANNGDLLLDRSCDVDVVLDALVAGVSELPWSLLWLQDIAYERPHWAAFQAAANRADKTTEVKQVGVVPQVEITDDWPAYDQDRKSSVRRNRRRNLRMLEKLGDVRLRIVNSASPDEVDTLVQRGFEVEDRSWKGEAGTSVVKTPGMLSYYQREAHHVAEYGELALTFLELQGQPIAFNYGWQSRGVHYTAKIGYDDEFRKCGPGQQMVMQLLEKLHGDESCDLLDFWGPEVDWHRGWATRNYPVGRLAVVNAGGVSPAVFRAYQRWQPRLCRLREHFSSQTAT